MTREQAFQEGFRLASICDSVSPSGFRSQRRMYHTGTHYFDSWVGWTRTWA